MCDGIRNTLATVSAGCPHSLIHGHNSGSTVIVDRVATLIDIGRAPPLSGLSAPTSRVCRHVPLAGFLFIYTGMKELSNCPGAQRGEVTKAAHSNSIDLATFCLHAGFVGDHLAAVPMHSGSPRRWVRRNRSPPSLSLAGRPAHPLFLDAVPDGRGSLVATCSRPSHSWARKAASSPCAAPRAGPRSLYSCRTRAPPTPEGLPRPRMWGCRGTAVCTPGTRDGGVERKASSTSSKERDSLLIDVGGDSRTSFTPSCFVLQHTRAGQRPWTMPLVVLY